MCQKYCRGSCSLGTVTVCYDFTKASWLLLAGHRKRTDRREGKGRRCWLGDGIDSIKCHNSQDDLKKGMSSSYSSYYPSAIHPILKIIMVQNSYSETRNWINSSPQIAATTFAFSSVFILLLCIVPTCSTVK